MGQEIEQTHKQYDKRLPQWMRCRDAFGGTDEVKAAGEKYLPKLLGQTPAEYKAYKGRALFYDATARTVEGLSGAILRKPPKVEYPDPESLKTIGASGEPFLQLLATALEEVVLLGRYGLLVDALPQTDIGSESRAFIVAYPAESITNWTMSLVGDRRQPVEIVLKEDDPSSDKAPPIYRRLMLGIPAPATSQEERMPIDEFLESIGVAVSEIEDSGRFYYQEIWKKENEKSAYEIVDRVVPRNSGGKLWINIPFVFFGATSIDPEAKKPPLLDLVDVNLSHYQNSADLEHGRHFTALPTAWAAGFNLKSDQEMKLGSAVVWVAEDHEAKAGFLEFSGSGLGHLADGMRDKENQMAVLGSRMLEQQKAGVEAASTVQLRLSGEGSVLSKMSDQIARGMVVLLEYYRDWSVKGGEVSVVLNKDFIMAPLDHQEMLALMQQWQAGAISWETFFWQMQRGERIAPDVTPDEERARIEDDNTMGAVLELE